MNRPVINTINPNDVLEFGKSLVELNLTKGELIDKIYEKFIPGIDMSYANLFYEKLECPEMFGTDEHIFRSLIPELSSETNLYNQYIRDLIDISQIEVVHGVDTIISDKIIIKNSVALKVLMGANVNKFFKSNQFLSENIDLIPRIVIPAIEAYKYNDQYIVSKKSCNENTETTIVDPNIKIIAQYEQLLDYHRRMLEKYL